MRPTLARLARAAGLGGWVDNRAGSVHLHLEGPTEVVDAFLEALPDRLPPAARLDSLEVLERAPTPGDTSPRTFHIRPSVQASTAAETPALAIPADLVTCPSCLREVLTPGTRRFGYAFTTCTDCGPRYTVVQATPYDRERTTLAAFPLCPPCAQEYADPDDRRYHAESTACPRCGPRLMALRPDGTPLPGDPLTRARAALYAGRLVALRGVGGFALVVHARDRAALERLRRLKRRPHRPLALMAPDVDTVTQVCRVDDAARAALTSSAGPIVLLPRRPAPPHALPADLLAPDTDTLGVMLPTSPLHALLFTPLPGDPTPPFDWLVATSGNRRGEPLCASTAQALERLDFADLVLTHDREIAWPCDDSLVRPLAPAAAPHNAPPWQVLRRARGFVPAPIALHPNLALPPGQAVLALGAGLKNTVALAFDDQVVLSPHVGDLDTPEALDACEHHARALPARLGRRPTVVAVDLHPDLPSTRLGRRLAAEWGVPVVPVAHHAAHAAACLAEHAPPQAPLPRALALAFDGVGLGDDPRDEAVWGGELLALDLGRGPTARRLGTFAAAPLPGGDVAAREPGRQLAGRLEALGLPEDHPAWSWCGPAQTVTAWRRQCQRGVNAPRSRAVGRLFDAASAALGLAPRRGTYEGQAAIRLETAARAARTRAPAPRTARDQTAALAVEDRGPDASPRWVVRWEPWLRAAVEARAQAEARGAWGEEARAAWAYAFHEAVAEAAAELVERAGADAGPPRPVLLTGGVFQNALLSRLVTRALARRGFPAHEHRRVPPNDGGVALGQAVLAGRKIACA